MHIDTKNIVGDVMNVYGVGCYQLDPFGNRMGPMHRIRLYNKTGPARAFRTWSTKLNKMEIDRWTRSPHLFRHPPEVEQWVVFQVSGVMQEIP